MRRSKKKTFIFPQRTQKKRSLKNARIFEEIQAESACLKGSESCSDTAHACVERKVRDLCNAYAFSNFRLDWMKREGMPDDFLQFTAFPGKKMSLEVLETFLSHLSRELQGQEASVSSIRIVKGVFIAEIAVLERLRRVSSEPRILAADFSVETGEGVKISWWSNLIRKWRG